MKKVIIGFIVVFCFWTLLSWACAKQPSAVKDWDEVRGSAEKENEKAYMKAESTKEAIELFDAQYTEPDLESKADPVVSAEDGGKGFAAIAESLGWENGQSDIVEEQYFGDPRALVGGELKQTITQYPSTIRGVGRDSNDGLVQWFYSFTHESLLSGNPNNSKLTAGLASHWKISDDKMSYWFRINPGAYWFDGSPVTTADVIATWRLLTDKEIRMPTVNTEMNKLKEPVAESKYIVRFDAKKKEWNNLYRVAYITLIPSKVLNRITGAQYMRKFQFEPMMGTGPYTLDKADIKKGKSFKLRKNHNYWGLGLKSNIGLNNFETLTWMVEPDRSLHLSKFERGDYDLYGVSRAQWWVERFNAKQTPEIGKGWMQKRRIFTKGPQGFSGIAINMRKPPFDDIRVREALTMLWNRDELIDKKFFNQYAKTFSYYGGALFESTSTERLPFDRKRAEKLLAEAGFDKRNAEGILVRDGEPFEVDLYISQPIYVDLLESYRKDLEESGIKLNLRQTRWANVINMLNSRNYKLLWIGWGASSRPNPKTMWHSDFADIDDTSNITGVKNKEIDRLIEIYDEEFDVDKRAELMQKIDGLLQEEHSYVLAWHAGYSRYLYWDKFSYPDNYLWKMGGGTDRAWWYDPAKQERLKRAMRNDEQLDVGETDMKYWLDN